MPWERRLTESPPACTIRASWGSKNAVKYHTGNAMPIFEYICRGCNHRFEALVFGAEKPGCPKCHSKKLAPQLSVFAVSAKGGSAPSASAGPCGTCGDPRGQGACSMDDLD